MRKYIYILISLLYCQISFAQVENNGGSSFSVGFSYLELKDELNHGMVFRGPDLRIDYKYRKINSIRYFEYQTSIGGGGKTTHETWGFTWYLSPINTHYSWNLLEYKQSKFYVGPSFKVQYNIQNYPELHSGPITWLTSYDLGIHLSYLFSMNDESLELTFQNNLLSFSSRPPLERDPYFFTTKVGENLSDIHSNMTLGTIKQLNQTELNLTLYMNGKKKLKSLSYQFNFLNFSSAPNYTQIFHQLKYAWYL